MGDLTMSAVPPVGRKRGTLHFAQPERNMAIDGNLVDIFSHSELGMDQYLLIPFLGGWTSIYQFFGVH